MRISVIVPTLEDDAALARLLPQLRAQRPAAHEILVIDGARSAATAALCARFGARWIAADPGRGAQLAHGAAQATGDVFWFVHADAGPDACSLAAIERAVAAGADGGHFRFRFDGAQTRGKRFLAWCINWRCRHGIAYGDQALFCTRAAYERSPGFALQPLFEEVALVRLLRRGGRFVALELPVRVSTRRWERDGYLRRTLHNRLLVLGFAAGIPPSHLARWYRAAPRPAGERSGTEAA